MINNCDIARSIKWHRENNGYSSAKIAGLLGIHITTYSKIENYKRTITASELKLIANIYNMSMDDLIIIPLKKINNSKLQNYIEVNNMTL